MLKLCTRLLQHTQIIPTATNVFLDFCGGAGGTRMVAIYMHHVVYPADDLQICYAQLFCILAEARARNYFRTLNGTFNNQLWENNLRGDSCWKRQQSISTWKAETYPRRTYQIFLPIFCCSTGVNRYFLCCTLVGVTFHKHLRMMISVWDHPLVVHMKFEMTPKSTRKYTIFQNQTWMETIC